ncbi:hypothetical protein PanWU01x14_346560 [Parasponia andersonii]|uniref:Uncharacterized protein n=1 Tax=Parasponia andersonii TaxID=3476 RepID=A0A2P5AC94_PARAD|nr:hypothetical protein PanWU01x14_346560 [Parasponia andersonii]
MKDMERSEESLCEKSMKVVANVIRFSAFSIAKRSLGTTFESPVAPSGNLQTTRSFLTVPSKPLLRAQKPQIMSNQTYLVKPEHKTDNGSSSYVVKEDMNVDGRASDYIRKVRQKNQRDLSVASETSSYQVPRSRFVK